MVQGDAGKRGIRDARQSLASALVRRLARARTDVALVAFDVVAVVLVYTFSLVLRFGTKVPSSYSWSFWRFLPVAVVTHVTINCLAGLYGQMWRHASAAEARAMAAAWASSTAALLVTNALLFFALDAARMPNSVVLLGTTLGAFATGAVRFHSRLFAVQRRQAAGFSQLPGTPVAIVGAGAAGADLVRDLRRDKTNGLVPIVVLDDDPAKQRRFLSGVPVAGAIDDLPQLVAETGAQRVVLAIPSGGPELVSRVAALAEVAGVTLKVLPGVQALVRGEALARDVRDVRIEDLLPRPQVPIDPAAVRGILAGRRVLITGAGGSIGSEIARQVAGCKPASLLLLDRDETHIHDVAASLDGDFVVQVLVDVREPLALAQVFAEHRPDVVFHAAAHKHVPLLEAHPSEAVLTNVSGTDNLVRLAAKYQVERFVFVSTDKAVRPSSVMGASKQIAEQLVLAGRPEGGRWCGVRFGNVLGSRGSVIPTFMRQIAAGGPITITDERMTRYFMSIPEAVELVLQSAALAEGGEVFMLDMGQPVNILAMAKQMIRLSGLDSGDFEFRFIGIRPGEKLEEELQDPGEEAEDTDHPSIVRLYPQIEPALAQRAAKMVEQARRRDDVGARRLLFEAVDGRGTHAKVVDLLEVAHLPDDRISPRDAAR